MMEVTSFIIPFIIPIMILICWKDTTHVFGFHFFLGAQQAGGYGLRIGIALAILREICQQSGRANKLRTDIYLGFCDISVLHPLDA